MYSPTVKSYFSGAGLLDIGLRDSGVTITQSLELDANACKTHRANFSHKLREEDKTEGITVPHNLNIPALMLIGDRPINVTITDDKENEYNSLGKGGGGFRLRPDCFELWRPDGSIYDGPKYSNRAVVRGYVVITYRKMAFF